MNNTFTPHLLHYGQTPFGINDTIRCIEKVFTDVEETKLPINTPKMGNVEPFELEICII